tara:strand:+ start:1538 stop:1852 length:315 start_codon:yes stop_codon:yes gene_type:complete
LNWQDILKGSKIGIKPAAIRATLDKIESQLPDTFTAIEVLEPFAEVYPLVAVELGFDKHQVAGRNKMKRYRDSHNSRFVSPISPYLKTRYTTEINSKRPTIYHR